MTDFWAQLDRLVAEAEVVIDRPQGTAHPRFSEAVYPLDYGYLAGTTTVDGGGVDVWVGTLGTRPEGIICTVDLFKCDAEIKILLGCTEAEMESALRFHNAATQRGLLVRREATT